MLSSAGIGKTWAYAYTPFLDRHSEPVRVSSKDELHIFAHAKEIRELEEALVKSASANAVVIGEPGVGKMSVVRGLAKKIREGKSLPQLNYRRVMKLVMADVLAEKTFGGVEEKLARLFREAEGAGNVILVIEDIEQYFMPNLATHLTEAFLPFLRSSRIKIIGLTASEGYERSIAEHSALATLFHPIRVVEPDEETMMAILADAALEQEKRFKIVILYSALRAVYALSKRFIPDMPFPEKAVVLLEETFIAGRERGAGIIKPDMVSLVLERKFGRAVSGVGEKEKEILAHLEEKLHEQVINQEEAIRAIADAMRRKRAGVAAGNKPVGSFLFLGPTGVGKTETAKALARTYFGSEDAMIRVDMSEYQNSSDAHRLIGSRESGDAGYLSEKIRARPFSLLLLDEIEKAHPNILNLFLRILDEGSATDGYGKKLDFTNAFVIATSNAGAELIRESLASGIAYGDVQKKLVDEVLRQNIFRPEFINRFDAVIVYSPLSNGHVQKVAELMLKSLALRLEQEGYHLVWDASVILWLAERGYSPVFGARELKRVIQEKIESRIAKEILENKYKKGDTISIAPPF
ncbi:ATP-dependent Clp protease ATP-binding subunit [Patescibacteria group bacterium]|nr:ATP-dependent Clp protease ATP-binding subunit [Patescibacteria group bacterium]